MPSDKVKYSNCFSTDSLAVMVKYFLVIKYIVVIKGGPFCMRLGPKPGAELLLRIRGKPLPLVLYGTHKAHTHMTGSDVLDLNKWSTFFSLWQKWGSLGCCHISAVVVKVNCSYLSL